MILTIDNYLKLPDSDKTKYIEECFNAGETVRSLAIKMNTYSNRIRREAIRLNIKLKDKSETRKMLLQSDKAQHPTKGRKRTDSEKIKIGTTKKKSWTEEAKQKMAEKSREYWNKKDKQETYEFLNKRDKGLREALVKGSSLEMIVYQFLIDEGYNVERHRKFLIDNEKMSVDLYLNDYNLVIEIDGPSHQLPIWGEEKLNKTQQIDQKKDGLLLDSGIRIIRVKFNKKVYLADQEYIKKELKKIISNKNKYQIIKVNIE